MSHAFKPTLHCSITKVFKLSIDKQSNCSHPVHHSTGGDIMTNARTRLETQGYVGVGARTLGDIQFGLRFSPALCAAGVALGAARASASILLVMMATAVIGAATPRHPFDWLYNYAVRQVLNKPAIPRNAAPRRFSCAVASVWLGATVIAFLVGWDIAGYVLGTAMAGMAAFVAVTHICLPSLVYTRLFERVGDVPEVSVQEAFSRLREGALVIDVRDRDFWSAGHVSGARRFSMGELHGCCASLDQNATVLVVCQSGVMSLKAAKTLRERGILGTCSVRGGMNSWLRANLPLATVEVHSG
jgi:rhodanese-related sulfurtransferase